MKAKFFSRIKQVWNFSLKTEAKNWQNEKQVKFQINWHHLKFGAYLKRKSELTYYFKCHKIVVDVILWLINGVIFCAYGFL